MLFTYAVASSIGCAAAALEIASACLVRFLSTRRRASHETNKEMLIRAKVQGQLLVGLHSKTLAIALNGSSHAASDNQALSMQQKLQGNLMMGLKDGSLGEALQKAQAPVDDGPTSGGGDTSDRETELPFSKSVSTSSLPGSECVDPYEGTRAFSCEDAVKITDVQRCTRVANPFKTHPLRTNVLERLKDHSVDMVMSETKGKMLNVGQLKKLEDQLKSAQDEDRVLQQAQDAANAECESAMKRAKAARKAFHTNRAKFSKIRKEITILKRVECGVANEIEVIENEVAQTLKKDKCHQVLNEAEVQMAKEYGQRAHSKSQVDEAHWNLKDIENAAMLRGIDFQKLKAQVKQIHKKENACRGRLKELDEAKSTKPRDFEHHNFQVFSIATPRNATPEPQRFPAEIQNPTAQTQLQVSSRVLLDSRGVGT